MRTKSVERAQSKQGRARQVRIVEAIRGFIATRGFAPTVREIAAMANLRSPSSVAYHLESLARQGVLRYEPLLSRSIVLTQAPAEPAPACEACGGSGVAA